MDCIKPGWSFSGGLLVAFMCSNKALRTSALAGTLMGWVFWNLSLAETDPCLALVTGSQALPSGKPKDTLCVGGAGIKRKCLRWL